MPTISKTPGKNEGAQFDFNELFTTRLKQEVCNYVAKCATIKHPDCYLTERRIRV